MRRLHADHPPLPPVPHPQSGVMDCPGDLPWRELVEAALRNGWSADGLQPEAPEATVAELVARRQPRPVAWGCGLLPARCSRVVVDRGEQRGYTSIRAPRKASGPDWAYLFIGADGGAGAGIDGRVVEASVALVRPCGAYLLADATFETPRQLFGAARRLARLEPFSTRRLEWAERRLVAAVPARPGLSGALRGRLAELGASLERTTGVPEALVFQPRLEHEGPFLVVSGAFDLVAAVIEAADRALGGPIQVALRYPDTHGVEAELTVGDTASAALEAAWELVEAAGPELHDARRVDADGTVTWLARALELGAVEPSRARSETT